MATRVSSVEWSAGIKEPVTAKEALAQIEAAISYAENAVDTVMDSFAGTAPPARSVLPELYDALDKASRARDAIKVIADRAPDASIQSMYVIAGRNLGVKLIDAANAALDKLASLPKGATVLPQIAKKAAAPLLALGGSTAFWLALGWMAWEISKERDR